MAVLRAFPASTGPSPVDCSRQAQPPVKAGRTRDSDTGAYVTGRGIIRGLPGQSRAVTPGAVKAKVRLPVSLSRNQRWLSVAGKHISNRYVRLGLTLWASFNNSWATFGPSFLFY